MPVAEWVRTILAVLLGEYEKQIMPKKRHVKEIAVGVREITESEKKLRHTLALDEFPEPSRWSGVILANHSENFLKGSRPEWTTEISEYGIPARSSNYGGEVGEGPRGPHDSFNIVSIRKTF